MPGRYLFILVVMFCIMLSRILWRALALFAYRWYVMRFYLRNWCESANLEIVPHIGPYNLVSEQD